MTYTRTTIGIAPEQSQALARLALEMGFSRAWHGQRIGNISGMLQHLAALSQRYGSEVVADALLSERLVTLTEMLEDEAVAAAPELLAAVEAAADYLETVEQFGHVEEKLMEQLEDALDLARATEPGD